MTDLDIRRPDRQPYELGDRYRPGSGPVVLTGVQAIARALIEQHVRDERAGLRVATFVSGYQGSPLGGVDRMLAAMPEVLQAHDITFSIVARLADVVAQCDGSAHAIVCDVRDPESCDGLITRSVQHLGALDAVVYATAIDPLVMLADTDAAVWAATC